MGQRGTKPSDNLLQQIDNLPVLEGGPPEVLAGDEEASGEWRRLVPLLNQLGHVCSLNEHLLVGYCQSFAVARRAFRELRRGDLLVEGSTGNAAANPLIAIMHQAQDRMLKAGKEMGMSPAMLQSIRAVARAEPGKKEEDLSDFLDD